MKRRVAILISGRGSNMAALIKAAAAADYPAEIALVMSNRADAHGLERAKASGVPTVVVESKPLSRRKRWVVEAVLQEMGAPVLETLADEEGILGGGAASADAEVEPADEDEDEEAEE